MTARHARRLVAAGAVLLALATRPGPVHADIWTYTGADGVVHFTNIPPKGKKAGFKMWLREAPASSTDAAPRMFSVETTRYDPVVHEAATRYVLPRALIKAVILVESNFNPGVVSYKGAEGLMQLMPATAAMLGVSDSFDPRENIFGGARYLRMMANRFGGDLVLTVAAYNAGPSAVERYGPGVPPYAETRNYVKRVLKFYYHYKSLGL